MRSDPTSSGPRAHAGILGSRLRELRSLVRSSVTLRAFSLLAMAAVALATASLAIDRAFRLQIEARAVALAAYGGVLAWLAWRALFRPLLVRLPDAALADILEKRFPELGDRLRSAVEFGRDPEVAAETGAPDIGIIMKRRVLRDAALDMEKLDTGGAVDTPGVVGAITGAAAVLAAAAIAAAILGPGAAIWWRRNVLLDDVEWPYRTRLAVEGFAEDRSLGVPRGDRLTLRVTASGEVPARVRLRVAYAGETLGIGMTREGDAFIHEHTEVTEPFTFDVEGGDFRSREHRVFIKERPDIASFRVTLTYPEYTAKTPETIEKDLAEIACPEGTGIEIAAEATKELRGAWLDTPDGRIELRVEPGAPRLAGGAYLPRQGGAVTVHLQDIERVPQDRWLRFIVSPVADRLPIVLSQAHGIGTMITSIARIPLKVKATDDYGVTAIGVEYEIAGEKVEARKGSAPFPPLRAPGPLVEEEPALDIAPFKAEEERRLDIRVIAVDNDGIHGSKTGHGPIQSFLVVSPERLLEEFLRREEEQRRLLERLIAEERNVRDATYRLIDESWKNEGSIAEPAVKEMVTLSRTERQLSRQLSGIAGAVRLVLDEMRNNQIAELTETERLSTAIIDPLLDLSERLLPGAGKKLDEIREMAKAEDRLREGLALAGDVDDIIVRMERVLASMRRLEGFTEIVNRLRGIIKVHDEASESVKRSYRREIDRFFEPDPGADATKGERP